MGWQDAPVVEEPQQQQPAAPQQPASSAAWMSAPVVKGGEFEPLIQQAAEKYQLPPDLLRKQVQAESSFNPNAVSKAGARGLMQLMPGTAKDLGVTDPHDPVQSIDGGARYMRQMLDMFGGDYSKALSAYNRGPGNERKYGDKMRPKETQDYLKKIMGDFQQSAAAKKAAPAANPDRDTTIAEDVARGAMGLRRGFFNDIDYAATQGVSALIPDSLERMLSVEGMTGAEQVAAREKTYQQQRADLGGQGFDPSRMVGNIVNPASLALGAGPLSAGTKLATAGMAAARGAGAAVMQPVEGTTGADIGVGKAQQAASGAILGPIAEGAGRLIVKGAGRLGGAIRNELSPEAADVTRLAKEFGVPVTAGNAAPRNKMLTGIEGSLENVRLPGVSLVPAREATAQGAAKAAQKLVDDQYSKLQSMSYNNLDTIKKVAAEGGPRAAEASKLLKMVDSAGDDEKAIMQASGNLAWFRKKLSADKLYNEADTLAGDTHIAPTNALSAIDNAIAKLPNVIDGDQNVGGLLSRWKTQLEGGIAAGDDDAIANAVNFMEDTAPQAGEVVPNTLARMRAFHTSLQKRIENATTDGTTDSGRLFLVDVAKAVNKDMESFTSSNPALKDAASRAKSYYEQHVVPYQARTLAKALTSKDPDKIYGSFVKAQAEGRGDYAAKNLFKALDEKGRQAVRYGIVKQAMANAQTPNGFSATEFAKTINSTEYGQYFRHSVEAQRVKGLTELFGHLGKSTPEHLAKYAPVFNGMAGLGLIGAGAVSVPAAALAYSSAGFLRWLMTSEPGKRVLLSANMLGKGGSKEKMGALLDRAAKQFGAATGVASGVEAGRPGEVLP